MRESELSGDRERVAQTSVNLAIGYSGQGNYRAATQAFQRALDICRELGLECQSSKVLAGMASVYNYQRDFELGLKYALEALAISEKFKDVSSLAAIYGNLALPYQGLGQFETARKYLELELKLAADTEDESSRMMASYNYGDLLHELHQPAAAEARFRESLALARKLDRRAMVVHSLLSLADLANESNRSPAAKPDAGRRATARD
jgi:tetratricopeptide (TPR) repeat protein